MSIHRTIMTRSQTTMTPMVHAELPDTVRKRMKETFREGVGATLVTAPPDLRVVVSRVPAGPISGMPPRHPGRQAARRGEGAPVFPSTSFVTPVRAPESFYGVSEEESLSLIHKSMSAIDDLLKQIEELIKDKGVAPDQLTSCEKALNQVKNLYALVISDTNRKIAELNKKTAFSEGTLLRLKGEKSVMKLWETCTNQKLAQIQERLSEGCLMKCYRVVVSALCICKR